MPWFIVLFAFVAGIVAGCWVERIQNTHVIVRHKLDDDGDVVGQYLDRRV